MLPVKVFLFGIDNAGKTAIAKTLKGEKVQDTEPTISFDITKVIIKKLEFAIWDAPGQVKFRESWKGGLEKAQVLMFVVDLSDEKRFDEAKREFDKVLESYETARIPLIVCFHKIDIPVAINNRDKAYATFRLQNIRGRDVFPFDTSIRNVQSLEPVKKKLVDIIQKTRW